MRHKWAIVGILVVLIVAVGLIGILWFVTRDTVLPHQMICQLTGKDAVNDTTITDVNGTDLGIMVYRGGRMYFVFGDTFGGHGPWPLDWRSNTMAYTTDTNPGDGVPLTGWIANASTGYAVELVSSRKQDNVEMTCIPTAIYDSSTCLYMYYMSVKHWSDTGGMWTCNNASIAYSLDGRTFTKAANVSWPGDSNFIEFGVVNTGSDALIVDEYVYLLATASGRFHDAYLVRVPQTQLLNQSAYAYYAGLAVGGTPSWSPLMSQAEPVIDDDMGEMSVMWNSYLHKYMLMNLDNVQLVILLRTADAPWGPWSAPRIVVTAREHPGLYAPNVHPQWIEDSGRIVYFTMSLWSQYNVFLMKVDLTQLGGLHTLASGLHIAGLLPWSPEARVVSRAEHTLPLRV
jgi:hypothetical protein